MAKSQRSNRKKALRTQRAQRSAEWIAEAEAKRLEALKQCMEAAPVEIVSTTPAEGHDEQQRGRDGADATAMAVEQPTKSSKKGKKKGVSVAKGIKKKKGAKAILAAQFSKRQKKQRR